MSSQSLEALKKRYNFNEISIAQWRDPSLSTLPGYGKKISGVFPEASGSYKPTYKRIIKPPESEPESESESEDEDDSDAESNAGDDTKDSERAGRAL